MHRSVINNTDLFAPYAAPAEKPAVRRHRQELQYPLQSSLPFPSLPSCLRPSRPLPSLLRAKKRKTNSFPYKWSESLQPRHPLELQIFHLCPGAPLLCHYTPAFILSPSPAALLLFALLCVSPPPSRPPPIARPDSPSNWRKTCTTSLRWLRSLMRRSGQSALKILQIHLVHPWCKEP